MTRAHLPQPSAVVLGVGARAANGLTALQVTMGVRAGKLEPRVSHLVDRSGDAIATARLASIGDQVMGLDRFVALGGPPLTQAAYPWLAAERAARRVASGIPAVIALPSQDRPGLDPRLARELLGRLEARSQVPLDHERSELVFGCRAGGAAAIERALARLEEGAEVVLAGGIDSYFDPDALEHLDRELRLHSLTAENGFIPGEGAGFVLLGAHSASHGPPALAGLIAVATEREPRPYGADKPCLALGITLAAKRAVEAVGSEAQRIGWVMTDVVDERHRVDEWAFAAARIARALAPDYVHEQPLLTTGDLGAASVGVMLAVAATRWQTSCAVDDVVLIAAHSDGADRAALVARAP